MERLSPKLLKNDLLKLYPFLTWKVTQKPNNAGEFTVSNLKFIRQTVLGFHDLGVFKSNVEALLSSALFKTFKDEEVFNSQQYSEIISGLDILRLLTSELINVLNLIVVPEEVDSVNIKLPPVRDFDELSRYSKEIHNALAQVIYNDEINGYTRIDSVENGSIWLNVFLGATAVAVVASLAWAAAVIYKKIFEGKMLEQQVRGLRIKNDSIQDIQNAQKEEIELLIDAEANYILTKHFQDNAPEQLERIKNSIKTFAELIEKGAEIQPALVAPEQVSNLFPDPKQILSLQSNIKQIGNSPSE